MLPFCPDATSLDHQTGHGKTEKKTKVKIKPLRKREISHLMCNDYQVYNSITLTKISVHIIYNGAIILV